MGFVENFGLKYASKSETIITPTAAATYVFGTQYSIELRRRDTGLLIYFANAAVISLSCNMLGFFCISQLLCRFNTDSVQDTANTHTNEIGDFIDPLCFGWALPLNYRPHRMGVNGPP